MHEHCCWSTFGCVAHYIERQARLKIQWNTGNLNLHNNISGTRPWVTFIQPLLMYILKVCQVLIHIVRFPKKNERRSEERTFHSRDERVVKGEPEQWQNLTCQNDIRHAETKHKSQHARKRGVWFLRRSTNNSYPDPRFFGLSHHATMDHVVVSRQTSCTHEMEKQKKIFGMRTGLPQG